MIVYFVKGPLHGQVREVEEPVLRTFYCYTRPSVTYVATNDPSMFVPTQREEYVLVGKDVYIHVGRR